MGGVGTILNKCMQGNLDFLMTLSNWVEVYRKIITRASKCVPLLTLSRFVFYWYTIILEKLIGEKTWEESNFGKVVGGALLLPVSMWLKGFLINNKCAQCGDDIKTIKLEMSICRTTMVSNT